MAYCSNCGQYLSENAKYCSNCGTASKSENFETNAKRENVYEGTIHKCPYCGEILPSFTTICPTCKNEIRGGNASQSVRNLFDRINEARTEKEKIQLIKTFPIPNSKEDILEFMLLASSNFDATYYASHLDEEDISDAWLTKIEQCYQKAKFIFDQNDDFNRIQNLYDNIVAHIETEEKANKVKSNKKRILNFCLNKPLFTIVAIVLFAYEISRIIDFQFGSGDLIAPPIILLITYIIEGLFHKKK